MGRANWDWRTVVLTVWAVSLSVTLFFGIFQALLMSDELWIVIPMVIVPPALFWLLCLLIRAVHRERLWAYTVLFIVAVAHLILPARQVLGSRPATVDGLFTTLVAGLIFAVLASQGERRRRVSSDVVGL